MSNASRLSRKLAMRLAALAAPCLLMAAALPVTSQQPTDEKSPVQSPDDRTDSLAKGIVGSKHDFSDGGRVPRDLCSPCHTPHITASQAPLLVKRSAAIEPQRPYQTKAGELSEASL